MVQEVEGCPAKTAIAAISPKIEKKLEKSQFLLRLIKSIGTGGRRVSSKNCNFSKNCEKLVKSQILLKLIMTSVKGGTRVPSKTCDFCNFSKNCNKLEKSQFLLKLSQVLQGYKGVQQKLRFLKFLGLPKKIAKNKE